MTPVKNLIAAVHGRLDRAGGFLPALVLRILLAWEYGESGIEKWRGENWFEYIHDRFPWPFSAIPTEISWALATSAEILGAIALLVGFATRFTAAVLIVLTVVAIYAVHWPADWGTLGELLQGYSISDRGFGNYKLPLIFIVMLLPLLFLGAGRASVDHWLRKRYGPSPWGQV